MQWPDLAEVESKAAWIQHQAHLEMPVIVMGCTRDSCDPNHELTRIQEFGLHLTWRARQSLAPPEKAGSTEEGDACSSVGRSSAEPLVGKVIPTSEFGIKTDLVQPTDRLLFPIRETDRLRNTFPCQNVKVIVYELKVPLS